MAKPELGIKRQCMNCGAKFYDLNRNPATCPRCGTPFQASAMPMALSRSAAAPAPVRAPIPADDETEVEPAGPELVSLDDVEAAEASKDDVVVDDEIEITEESDDTFLEEEEEGEDDVAGLIDGDIEDDEEA